MLAKGAGNDANASVHSHSFTPSITAGLGISLRPGLGESFGVFFDSKYKLFASYYTTRLAKEFSRTYWWIGQFWATRTTLAKRRHPPTSPLPQDRRTENVPEKPARMR